MLLNKTTVYYDVLDDIVKNYNNTYHTGIGTTPLHLWETGDIPPKTRIKTTKEKHIFKIGDIVRVREIKNIFDKSDLPLWSEKVYIIVDTEGKGYILADDENKKLRRGRRIGTFMPYELQLITTYDKNDKEFKTEILKLSKEKKQRIILKREDIKTENIQPTKRLRKKKKIYDI